MSRTRELVGARIGGDLERAVLQAQDARAAAAEAAIDLGAELHERRQRRLEAQVVADDRAVASDSGSPG